MKWHIFTSYDNDWFTWTEVTWQDVLETVRAHRRTTICVWREVEKQRKTVGMGLHR